jgi:hypothetical protein
MRRLHLHPVDDAGCNARRDAAFNAERGRRLRPGGGSSDDVE